MWSNATRSKALSSAKFSNSAHPADRMDAALATQDAFGRPLEHRPDWAAGAAEEEGPPGAEELGRAGWTQGETDTGFRRFT